MCSRSTLLIAVSVTLVLCACSGGASTTTKMGSKGSTLGASVPAVQLAKKKKKAPADCNKLAYKVKRTQCTSNKKLKLNCNNGLMPFCANGWSMCLPAT